MCGPKIMAWSRTYVWNRTGERRNEIEITGQANRSAGRTTRSTKTDRYVFVLVNSPTVKCVLLFSSLLFPFLFSLKSLTLLFISSPLHIYSSLPPASPSPLLYPSLLPSQHLSLQDPGPISQQIPPWFNRPWAPLSPARR